MSLGVARARERSSVTLSDNLLGDLDRGGKGGRKRARRSLYLLRAEIHDRIGLRSRTLQSPVYL